MLKLPNDLREFVRLLNSHEVRYLVVGGYAVAYHGWPRMTGDIDFFLEVSDENARKVEHVLTDFSFASLGLTARDFLQPGMVVQLGYPPNRIDLLTGLSGVEFADAWERRVTEEVDGLAMTFIDLESLRTNKAASGRLKDLADLDHLQ
jgi:hypothetical protein